MLWCKTWRSPDAFHTAAVLTIRGVDTCGISWIDGGCIWKSAGWLWKTSRLVSALRSQMVEIRKAQNKHPPNAQRSTTGGEIPIMHEAVSCQTREIKLWGNALIAGFPFQGTSTFPVYCLVLSSIFKSDWCHAHFLKCVSNAWLYTKVLFIAKSLLDGQSGRWRAAWVWSQLLERMQVLCSHFSLFDSSASSELGPWMCSIHTESHFLPPCHDSGVLNGFFQHRRGAAAKPKQCHASWELAPLQLMLSKFAFQAFSWHWKTLCKCESVFRNHKQSGNKVPFLPWGR